MKKLIKNYVLYIFAVIASLACFHLFYSVVFSCLTYKLYDNYVIDVRNFKLENQTKLIQAYLSNGILTTTKPVLLVLGSSFSYGYSILARNIYSEHLKQYFPKHKIMNTSVIGGGGFYALNSLLYLQKNHLSVNKLFVEVNYFNFVNSKQFLAETPPSKRSWLSTLFGDSYFEFYLENPRGVKAITSLEFERVLPFLKKRPHKYLAKKLQDNYAVNFRDFSQHYPIYKHNLNTLLDLAEKVSTETYFFISPIYSDGVKKSQFKLADIAKELKELNAICEQHPHIHCLTPGLQFSEKNFMDLTHFNAEGHRMLAAWLTKRIRA